MTCRVTVKHGQRLDHLEEIRPVIANSRSHRDGQAIVCGLRTCPHCEAEHRFQPTVPVQTSQRRILEGPSAEGWTAEDSCRGAGSRQVVSHMACRHGDSHTNSTYRDTARKSYPWKSTYSDRNKFERFRGFLELISRFEFEFCRLRELFFWRIRIFGVFM